MTQRPPTHSNWVCLQNPMLPTSSITIHGIHLCWFMPLFPSLCPVLFPLVGCPLRCLKVPSQHPNAPGHVDRPIWAWLCPVLSERSDVVIGNVLCYWGALGFQFAALREGSQRQWGPVCNHKQLPEIPHHIISSGPTSKHIWRQEYLIPLLIVD